MGRVVHLSLVQTTAGIDDDFGDAILLLVQHGPELIPLASQWRVKVGIGQRYRVWALTLVGVLPHQRLSDADLPTGD